MARKTVDVTITAEGRDKGKTYVITEMSASRAERWGARALNAMAKAMGDIPPELMRSGMAGLTAAALSAFARSHFDEIAPLLDEMFTCIQIKEPVMTRALIEEDIEEVATRIKLREEVLELHLGFFKAAVNWILTAAKRSFDSQQAAESMPLTPTFPNQSEPSSLPA